MSVDVLGSPSLKSIRYLWTSWAPHPYGVCARPGLPVPEVHTVSVDVLASPSLIVRTVSVDVLASPSLIVRTVSVDVLGSPSLIVSKVCGYPGLYVPEVRTVSVDILGSTSLKSVRCLCTSWAPRP